MDTVHIFAKYIHVTGIYYQTNMTTKLQIQVTALILYGHMGPILVHICHNQLHQVFHMLLVYMLQKEMWLPTTHAGYLSKICDMLIWGCTSIYVTHEANDNNHVTKKAVHK